AKPRLDSSVPCEKRNPGPNQAPGFCASVDFVSTREGVLQADAVCAWADDEGLVRDSQVIIEGKRTATLVSDIVHVQGNIPGAVAESQAGIGEAVGGCAVDW